MLHTGKSSSIVICHRAHLESRCRERGYELNEVMGCVVNQDGDQWTIDTNSPAYPQISKLVGVGTELSNILKRFGIEPTPTCQCRDMADKMDILGPDECAKPERIEEVVAVMREEAKARGLPFIDAAARMLIRRAIKNAKRKAAT